MASKRLGSSLDESANAAKKPKLEIKPVKAFCGISDITPQTATLPQELRSTASPNPTTDNADTATLPTVKQANGSSVNTWIVIEHWHPKDPTPDRRSMVKILGVFNNAAAALHHAEEHTGALYQVATDGIGSPPCEDVETPNAVFERRLEYFRGKWESEDEEKLEDGLKKWTVCWGDVTEVWVEKRQVYESQDDAGYFTPLPVDDDVPGKELGGVI